VLIKANTSLSKNVLYFDPSGFLMKSMTPADLVYANENEGYPFDAHEIRRFLEAIIHKMSISVDVGANLGAISFLLSKKSEQVLAFEPVTDTYMKLKDNLELNGLQNVHAYKIACSDAPGLGVIYKNGYHGHSSFYKRRGFKHSEVIEKHRLEDFLKDMSISRIDLIKIDVEGSEFSVLKGMGSFLNPTNCKKILWEHSHFVDPTGEKSAKVYSLLVESGYRIVRLDGGEITIENVLKESHIDLLAVH
jgi:FkbM family methyltransferase